MMEGKKMMHILKNVKVIRALIEAVRPEHTVGDLECVNMWNLFNRGLYAEYWDGSAIYEVAYANIGTETGNASARIARMILHMRDMLYALPQREEEVIIAMTDKEALITYDGEDERIVRIIMLSEGTDPCVDELRAILSGQAIVPETELGKAALAAAG